MSELITFFDVDKDGHLYTSPTKNSPVKRIIAPGEGILDIDRSILEVAQSGRIISQAEGYVIKPDDKSLRFQVNAMLPAYLKPKLVSIVGYFHYCSTFGLFVSSDKLGRHGDYLPKGDKWENIPMAAFADATGGKLISYHDGYVVRPTDKSRREEVNTWMPADMKPKTAPVRAPAVA